MGRGRTVPCTRRGASRRVARASGPGVRRAWPGVVPVTFGPWPVRSHVQVRLGKRASDPTAVQRPVRVVGRGPARTVREQSKPSARAGYRSVQPRCTSSPTNQRPWMPRVRARHDTAAANRGLVARRDSSRMQVNRRRSLSATQSAGKYKARFISAYPSGETQVRWTAICHTIAAAPPEYLRDTPTATEEHLPPPASSAIKGAWSTNSRVAPPPAHARLPWLPRLPVADSRHRCS